MVETKKCSIRLTNQTVRQARMCGDDDPAFRGHRVARAGFQRYAGFRSREEHTSAEKVLSAMRQGFGGHIEASPQDSSRKGDKA